MFRQSCGTSARADVPSGVLSNWFYDNISCGCGNPQSVLDELVVWLDAMSDSTSSAGELLVARLDQSTPGLVWAWMSMLDNAGLTEHGSCLPGWLTESGCYVLSAIRNHPDIRKWEDGPTVEEYEEWGWWPHRQSAQRRRRGENRHLLQVT